LNAIGAIIAFQLIAVELWDCNIDADVFVAWVRNALLPSAPAQSVIVMDNATFHKRSDVIDAIEERGHTIEFLPSYSPDLNPIEKKWAQAKARRRQRRCTPLELFSSASMYAEL
jgi:transposase